MAYDYSANQPYQIYQRERMKAGLEKSCSGWAAGHRERHTHTQMNILSGGRENMYSYVPKLK